MFSTISDYEQNEQRLCLDKYGDKEIFRLAWRGNSISEKGFINRPAEFTLIALAELILKAYKDGYISKKLFDKFTKKLVQS